MAKKKVDDAAAMALELEAQAAAALAAENTVETNEVEATEEKGASQVKATAKAGKKRRLNLGCRRQTSWITLLTTASKRPKSNQSP
jgi:hypothetical protein